MIQQNQTKTLGANSISHQAFQVMYKQFAQSARRPFHFSLSLLLFLSFSIASVTVAGAWDISKDQRRHNILSQQSCVESSMTARPAMSDAYADGDLNGKPTPAGRLEELKQKEAELARQLAGIRMEKLAALRSRPLKIGVIGFGRFGQFIAKTFAKHGEVVVTSRSDYTAIANKMGATYVPLDNPRAFLEHDLDVVIMAVSIVSFESTVQKLVPSLTEYVEKNGRGPLLVDVLSVKEHAREIMLKYLPKECDILCTHPMFGPDSGKNGWHNLNFVYEKTRIHQMVFDPDRVSSEDTFVDSMGNRHSIHEDSEAHIESMDRVERFLSIWEEEGCRMVPMSCKAHDEYAANSQFITHLMGRILGKQGLSMTPIDTKGFESVLQLIDSTTADSFDLFYGLYKYNIKNSRATIAELKSAMDNVVDRLKTLEQEEQEKLRQEQQNNETPLAAKL